MRHRPPGGAQWGTGTNAQWVLVTEQTRCVTSCYACNTCRGTGEQLGTEECEVRCLLLDPPPEEEEEEEEERTSGCPDPVLFFNLSLRNFLLLQNHSPTLLECTCLTTSEHLLLPYNRWDGR